MLARIRQKLFHFYFLLTRPLTLGVRAIIRNEQGQILLVKHAYSDGWHLPGGGVEAGETCEAALERELAEEVGIEPIKLTPARVIHNSTASKRDHVIFYAIDEWRQNPNHQPSPLEIESVIWFSECDLPQDLAPDSAQALKNK